MGGSKVRCIVLRWLYRTFGWGMLRRERWTRARGPKRGDERSQKLLKRDRVLGGARSGFEAKISPFKFETLVVIDRHQAKWFKSQKSYTYA